MIEIPKIGDILISEGIITEDILNKCLDIQKELYARTGIRKVIGEILLDEGYISKRDQLMALNKKLEFQLRHDQKIIASEETIEILLRAYDSVQSTLSDDTVAAIILRIHHLVKECESRRQSIERLKTMPQRPVIIESIKNYEKDILKYEVAINNLQNDLRKFSKNSANS